MKFVNKSTSPVYTSMSGSLNPGRVSADIGYGKEDLKNVLARIVKSCGNKLYIRLNDTELGLVKSLMELHDKGMAFKPTDLPGNCVRDPYNRESVTKRALESQKSMHDAIAEVNKEKGDRNRLVDGETKDESGNIKESNEDILARSGFASILEENKKIASGQKKLDPITAADPFGQAFKDVNARNLEEAKKDNSPHSDEIAPGASKVSAPKDGAKEESAIAPGANASAPAETKPTRPGVKMDNLAAETAKILEFGASDLPGSNIVLDKNPISPIVQDKKKTPTAKDNKKTRGRKPAQKQGQN